MLTPIAPWLATNPLSFVDAAAKGAGLGLQASQIATGAQEAADRLRESYAQLAAEQSMHALTTHAAAQRAAAELAMHGLLAKQANDARQDRISIARTHQDMLEKNAVDRLREAGAKKLLHVRGGVYGYDPKVGSLETMLAPPKEIDPFTRMKYQAALGRAKSAQAALNRPGLEDDTKAAIQKDLDEANAELKAIESGGSVPSGPASEPADGPIFSQVPKGWSSITSPTDTSTAPLLGLPSFTTDESSPDTNSFSVGKYKVTPLK